MKPIKLFVEVDGQLHRVADSMAMTPERSQRREVMVRPTSGQAFLHVGSIGERVPNQRTAPSGWTQYDWDVYQGHIKDPLG